MASDMDAMNDICSGCGCFGLLFAVGVGAFVAPKAAWWTAIVYALFWPVWVGYRLAEWLWR